MENIKKTELKKEILSDAIKLDLETYGRIPTITGFGVLVYFILLIFFGRLYYCAFLTLGEFLCLETISIIVIFFVGIKLIDKSTKKIEDGNVRKPYLLRALANKIKDLETKKQNLPNTKSRQFNEWVNKLGMIKERLLILSSLPTMEQLAIETQKLLDEEAILIEGLESIDLRFQQEQEEIEEKLKLLAEIKGGTPR